MNNENGNQESGDRAELNEQIELFLKAIQESGAAGGMIGPNGEIATGTPNWHERTKDQRFSEKVKTHGYPLGLAKSTRWHRDELVSIHSAMLEVSSSEDQDRFRKVLDALGWAIDAERFLGTWSGPLAQGLRPEDIDRAAGHLILWLRERGFEIVPILDQEAATTPD